jgi:tRNA 5-methylaminomethyl-2-thiouridine biosynthesis bifunctional protein
VLANGYQATQFEQTAYLPLKPIRGQMTMIEPTEESQNLKVILCADGHVLPYYKNQHALGASYHLGKTEQGSFAADDEENLRKLAKLPTDFLWSRIIRSSWSGIRAATTDYLPLVGPVPDRSLFSSDFSSLATNAKRWLPQSGPYLPGLFICAGFGSRGLTSIPLAAETLASMINKEFLRIPQTMLKSLAPARFLIKTITKTGYT